VIITSTSHGRTNRDGTNLARHLGKTNGQRVRVFASRGLTPGLTLAQMLGDLRRLSDQSGRARVGFHHLTLSPGAVDWTREQTAEAVRRILAELGAASHAWILIEHADHARAAPGGASTHYHLVVAHVGPDGKALRLSQSYARLEAVARTLEQDNGESLTPGRHGRAVSTHLCRMGRRDVVAALDSVGAGDALPRSAMSSAGRQRAARMGVDLPAVRAAVRAAWATDDLVGTLGAAGLRIGMGNKRGVVVVKTVDGRVAGALDRLAQAPRAEVRERLEAEMARKKKGIDHEQQRNTDQRQRPDAGAAWPRPLAGRRRDQDGGGQHIGHPDAGRGGIPRPRLALATRSESRHPAGGPVAAERRRRRALAEQRVADAVARRRDAGGRAMADDVTAAKAALWRQLFGADLSPALVGVLHYVDVRERVVKLTSGGWVRDERETLFASGADPVVVAVLVEAAKSKGWTNVRLWGSEAFLAEARQQFEAAGFAVMIGDAPPTAIAAPAEAPPAPNPGRTAEVVAEFRRRRAAAEASLADLRRPADPPGRLVVAQAFEREADDGWRELFRLREKLRQARDVAKDELDKAGMFGRAATRRELEEAQARLTAAADDLDAACNVHAAAKARAADLQRSHVRNERQRRAGLAVQERQAEAALALAIACEHAAAEPELAARGEAAIEDLCRERLAKEAADRARRDRRQAARDADGTTTSTHP
jgi:hypothetical protein